MMSGGEGRGGEGGWVGGVKKCFLSLRPTALLSAEGKKGRQLGTKIKQFFGRNVDCHALFIQLLGECASKCLSKRFNACIWQLLTVRSPCPCYLKYSNIKENEFLGENTKKSCKRG
jgi:hypothetical protein